LRFFSQIETFCARLFSFIDSSLLHVFIDQNIAIFKSWWSDQNARKVPHASKVRHTEKHLMPQKYLIQKSTSCGSCGAGWPTLDDGNQRGNI